MSPPRTGPTRSLAAYAARLAGDWTRRFGAAEIAELEGTLAKIDLSGFTRLSERLGASSVTGAEELNIVLNDVFGGLIDIAHRFGGDVLQFGGDALLIWYEGTDHQRRAAAASWAQQRALLARPAERTPVGPVRLRMSVGAATGRFGFATVGRSHRELIVVGDDANRTIRLEQASVSGSIYVDDGIATTAATRRIAEGVHRLVRPPADLVGEPTPAARREAEQFLAPEIIEAESAGVPAGEHRRTGVAFIDIRGIAERARNEGLHSVHEQLAGIAEAIEQARDEYGVQWTATDLGDDSTVFIVYSGAPLAREGGDERLLRACGDIRDACRRLPIRIGVHSGRAFAADIGSPERRTYAVIGDTTNMAARLMTKAPTGAILASREVIDRAGTTHTFEWLAPFPVKGRRAPVEAAIVGEARPANRAGRSHALPLVGRDGTIAEIHSHLDAARAVLLTGAAGIGKSRLVAAMVEHFGATDDIVGFGGVAYVQQHPYATARDDLRRLLGPGRDEVLALAADDLDLVPLLSLPLDLQFDPTAAVDRLDPAFIEPTRHALLVRLIHRAAARSSRRLLVTVEEAQWLDRASLGLLDALAASSSPDVTVVATARSAVDDLDLAHWVPVPLEPLGDADARRLALAAAGEIALGDDTLDAIVGEAAGNPLFIIGLARSVGQHGDGLLPESADAVIAAQIDLLSTADRTLLREASVLGHAAPLATIGAVLESPDAADPDRWDSLRDVVAVENGTVRFHHDAFRRSAYEGLAVRRRRVLHARIADELLAGGTAPLAEVALHLHLAARYDEAFDASARAGSSVAESGALGDAAALFVRALDCARRASSLAADRVADVSVTAAEVLEVVGRYDDALGALDLAARIRGPHPALLTRRATVLERTGATAAALRLLRRAERSDPRPDDLADVLLRTASVLARRGRLRPAYVAAQRALDVAERLGDEPRIARALIRLEMNGSELNLPAAVDHGRRAREILERLGEDRDLGHLLLNLGAQAKATDDWSLAAQLYAESEAAYRRAGDTTGRALAVNNRAEVLLDQGRFDEALTDIEQARRIFRAAGHGLGAAATLSTIGTIYARQRRTDEARQWLEQAATALAEADFDILVLDALLRIAENELFADQPGAARAALDRAGQLTAKLGDVGGLDLWRQRLEAVAEARAGGDAWARGLRAIAATARVAHAAFDVAMCLDALAALGAATADELAERASLAGQLGIVTFPPLSR